MEREGSPSLLVGLHLFDTTDAVEIPEPLLSRLLCHALVQMLPEAGLPEAVESLSDMVQFYQNPPPAYRLLPHGPSVPIQIGPPVVRPVFPVTEEG
jgi:hypothetical protein